jgi:hypothetical protein
MSFHASAYDIRVDDGHILRATLLNGEGEAVEAEFDLNTAIGNNDGTKISFLFGLLDPSTYHYSPGVFEWGGENFSDSAENISFDLEGDDQVPVLRAALRKVDGGLVWRDINLGERISNENGGFAFGE